MIAYKTWFITPHLFDKMDDTNTGVVFGAILLSDNTMLKTNRLLNEIHFSEGFAKNSLVNDW